MGTSTPAIFRLLQVTLRGLEQTAKTPGKPKLLDAPGAKSGALAEPPLLDPDLAGIVAAWAILPEPIRRAVLALLGTVSPPIPAV